jgi:hypothetical protein
LGKDLGQHFQVQKLRGFKVKPTQEMFDRQDELHRAMVGAAEEAAVFGFSLLTWRWDEEDGEFYFSHEFTFTGAQCEECLKERGVLK